MDKTLSERITPGEPSLDDAGFVDADADISPPLPPTPAKTRSESLLLAASIVLISFNLRTPVTSIGPVLPELIRSLGLGAPGASLLTTLPSLCFGLFGPLAPALSRRYGTERALLAVVVVIAAGTALRAIAAVPALFAGQILASIGIGVVNVLLPSLVKRDFPHRAPMMTGLYTMSLCAGAAVAAGATVPLEAALGGSWPNALALWAIPIAFAAAFWTPQLPPWSQQARRTAFKVTGLWTDPLAWQVTFFMGLEAALAYIVFGWLAVILRERGLGPVEAGLVLSLSTLAQAAGSLLGPAMAAIKGDQRAGNIIAAVLCVAGLLGCLYAPLSTVAVWAILLGIAQGALFALALTMIVLRSPDMHVATHLSNMVQSVGYLLASIGPLMAGLLHSWTGDWDAVAIFCAAIGAATALSGYGAGKAGHVRAISVPML